MGVMPLQVIINHAIIWKAWGKRCVVGLLDGPQYPMEELIWTIAMNRRGTPSAGINTVSPPGPHRNATRCGYSNGRVPT